LRHPWSRRLLLPPGRPPLRLWVPLGLHQRQSARLLLGRQPLGLVRFVPQGEAMTRAWDMTGTRAGRLLAVAVAGRTGRGDLVWECACECGGRAVVRGTRLRSGGTLSCGCLQRERSRAAATIHGRSESAEYRSWVSMIARCENPKYHHFHGYGGRGITICPEWRESFAVFLRDMGRRPPGTSLDRINNDKGYGPENCRWATRVEQSRNRSFVVGFKRVRP
jgi:hypothetical protein